MDKIRASWDKRAAAYGSDLSGVLFKGLTTRLNKVIHEWHSRLVTEIFLPTIPQGGRILDLGCGYGRIADVIANARSDITVVGQDLAVEYCRLFKKEGRSCVQADASQLPFVDQSFNGVLAITSLMYLPRNHVRRALEDLRRLLLPNGSLFLVDPGCEIQKLAALSNGAHSPTGGSGFSRNEYVEILIEAGYSIDGRGGNSRFSRALFFHKLVKSRFIFSFVMREAERDRRGEGYKWYALHRWLLASISKSATPLVGPNSK